MAVCAMIRSYSFKPRFAAQIISGAKTSTIRRNGTTAHARRGDLLQLYTGALTSGWQKLLVAPCFFAAPIEVRSDRIIRAGAALTDIEADALAQDEGFADFNALRAWCDQAYGLPVRNLTQLRWHRARASFVGTPKAAPQGASQ